MKAVSEPKAIPQMEPWLGPEERAAVDKYLAGGGWLTEFQRTKEFEEALGTYLGSKHCVVVSNGTVSLAIAVMAAGLGRDDEVLVPDYTMIASANAVRLAGAKVKLVDVDRDSLCLTADAISRAITPRTKAVMHVTLNGRAPGMAQVERVCHEKGVTLISDAAQSLGSTWGGRHLATFGQVGSLSFSTPKIITTGQGGALVTDDDALAQSIRLIKDFGREKAGVDRHIALGFNFKFTDLQAVIGLEQMKKLPTRVERKKAIYRLYRDLLAGVDGVELIETDLHQCAPWFIDVLLDAKRRQAVQERLKQAGIGTRPFYPALHTQEPYHGSKGEFPNALEIAARGLWLPSATQLTDTDIHRICDALKSAIRGESP